MRTFESIVPYSTGTLPSFTVQIIHTLQIRQCKSLELQCITPKSLIFNVRTVPIVHLLYF